MTSRSVAIHKEQKFTPVSIIPQVELAGMHVVVNGKRHSLSRKGRAFRVIRAFFASDKPALSSQELITILDAEEGIPRRMTGRGQSSRHSALVRMLSRIREEFSEAFRSITPQGTSWFYYDRIKNHWVLFKLPAAGADGLLY